MATPSALAARDSPMDSERVLGRQARATRLRFADALHGEQRTFDLHVMHVGQICNADVGHRRMHRGRDHLDLRHPAEMFGRQRRRVRPSDRERRAFPLLAFDALEHGPVRRHAAFGAAGHHQTDPGGLLR